MDVTLIVWVWLVFTNVATKVPRSASLLTIAAFSTLTVPSRSLAPAVMLLIRSVG